MTAGLDHADGDAVIVIDADLQDPPELIPDMVAAWRDGFDVVLMQRRARARARAVAKRATARCFYRRDRRMATIDIPENVGDFRLLSRRAVDALRALRERSRFMKGTLRLGRLPERDDRLRPRQPRRRRARSGTTGGCGTSRWRASRRSRRRRSSSRATSDSARHSSRSSTASSSSARRCLYGDPVRGYPTLVVLVLFLGGLQLMALGIIGEYLARMFVEVKQRPLYFVQAVLPRGRAPVAGPRPLPGRATPPVTVAVELTRRERQFLWALLAFVVVVRAVSLAAYPLPDPSESRYAEMARKMLETGNWLVPQFEYGTPFWGKPPLSIWMSAAAMQVFGANEFAARLPSLLLIGGCAALVHAMARAAAGTGAALLAVVVFATTGFAFVAAGAVITDPTLAFGTTLSMAGFWLAAEGPSRTRRAWGYLFFVGIAVGLLGKGPIGVVLTGLPLVAWIAWQRSWRGLVTRLPWATGTLLVAVLVVPWYWAAERATPGFLDYFLVGEHWKRFTEPGWTGDRYGVAHAWKRGWIWLFWVAAAVPWSIVALDWLVRAIRTPREVVRARLGDPFFRYVICWALAPLVFFTVSRNVLITYVLPGLPAFALVIAAFGPFAGGAVRVIDRAERRAFAFSIGAILVLVGALATQQARIDRDFAQRGLVRAFEARRDDPGARLVYIGDVPVSAVFYTGGKVEHMVNAVGMTAYLADPHRDFFAVRKADLAAIPEALRARVTPVASFDEFELLAEDAVRPAN